MFKTFEDIRVLVVDSERLLADNLAETLRSQGYNTRAVYSSDAAIAVADEFRPHAVICEVVMARVNGIDLACHFAEHHPFCRVLLTSATEAVIEILEDAVPGGFTFIRKPLHAFDVLDFLSACLST